MLLLVFFLSGFSALTYEVLWFRALARIFGNTIYATSTVLAVFMLGLALGSFCFGRIADKVKRPLFLYSLIELGIAASAFLMPFAFEFAMWSYKGQGSGQPLLAITRIFICFACLLIPTTLMGATFPVMNRYIVKGMGSIGERVSTLYAINTFGAMIGAGLTGFWLISVLGENFTTYLAVAFNVLVFLTTFSISLRQTPVEVGTESAVDLQSAKTDSSLPRSAIYIALIAVFFTGFTSLACEVLWTRILTVFLGTSIYAFTTILVLFLLGIVIGSFILSRMVDKTKDLFSVLGVVIFLVGLFTIAAQYFFYVAGQDPALTILRWKGIGHWTDIGRFFLSSTLPIVIVTIFFGIAFPLAAKIFVRNMKGLGKSLGSLYAVNTIGAVIGPLVAGFVMIPMFGTHGSIMFFAILNAALGIAILFYIGKMREVRWAALVFAGVAVMGVFLGTVRDPFFASIYKGIVRNGYEVNYHREDADSTVTIVSKDNNLGSRQLLINGVAISGISVENFLIGHLPMMMHPNPKDILVICFGVGTSYSSSFLYPINSVDAVEISENVISAFRATAWNAGEVLSQPKGKIHIEDGRSFLVLSDKKYDVLTIDASPPLYSAGTVNLLTREFLMLAKSHLKEHGQMMLWVPTNSATVEDFRMILATYASVFPNISLWGFPDGSGVLMFGSDDPVNMDLERLKNVISSNENIDGELWGRKIDPDEGVRQIMTLFILDGKKAASFAESSPILTDNNPYTEFPLFRRDSKSQSMRNGFLIAYKAWVGRDNARDER